MNNRFEGKVVLITGAGSGLGQAAAVRIAKEGAKLSLVDLKQDLLEKTKKMIPETDLLLITADVSDEQAVEDFVRQTIDRFGRIDGFYNNAGIEGKQNLTEDYGSDEFQKVLSINLNGVFYGMKYVLKVMKNQACLSG